jgi:hypothetical protein
MAENKGELRLGTLFEMGPDGYGYLIDECAGGRSYAFDVSMIAGTSIDDPTELEGVSVTFTIVEGRPTKVNLVRPDAKAHEASR